jgi:hypothetical protein
MSLENDASRAAEGLARDLAVITQVVLRERQSRDRGWWDVMACQFWPDSRVDLSWYHGDGPGFVEASRRIYERGSRPLHRPFAPAIDLRGSRAHAEFTAQSWSTFEHRGRPLNLYCNMRLNYRLERRSGEWRIFGFTSIYEDAYITAQDARQTVDIDWEELGGFRKSYAALTWVLRQRGADVSQDELGVDRPDAVEAYYAATRAWLLQEDL